MNKQFYTSILKTSILSLLFCFIGLVSFAQNDEVINFETTENAPVVFFVPNDLIANQAITITTPPIEGFAEVLDPTVFGIPPGSLGLGIELVIQYTPNPGFIGIDNFEMQVCDTVALTCMDFEIQITVTDGLGDPTNGPVILVEDFFQVSQNVTSSLNPLENDFGSNLQLTDVFGAAFGTVVLNGNLVDYTPNAGYAGPDAFSYTACDDMGNCATGASHVDVSFTNDGSVDALDDFIVIPLGDTLIDVLANDVGTNLQLTNAQGSGWGTASIVNNQLLYVSPSFNPGFDVITYTACDAVGNCDVAFLQIAFDLSGGNGFFITNDFYNVNSGETSFLNVLENDSGENLTITGLTYTGSGTAIVSGNQIEYTSAPGFEGPDFIFYDVCDSNGNCGQGEAHINVTHPGNGGGPLGDSFIFFQTNINTPFDLYMDQNTFSYDDVFVSDQASNGLVIIDTPINLGYDPNDPLIIGIDTLIRYQPNQDFTGLDTFFVGFASNNFQDTTLFGIEMLVSGNPPTPDPLSINDDSFTVEAGTTSLLDVLANDTGNGLILNTATGSVNSSVDLANGLIAYTPNPGFEGIDIIQYTACESGNCGTGTVTITVSQFSVDFTTNLQTEENTMVSISGFDILGFPFYLPPSIIDPPSNGTFFSDAVTITYTPNDGFIGVDTFVFELCLDQFTCFNVEVIVDVVPNIPVDLAVNDDLFTVDAENTTLLNVLANDAGEGIEITTVFGSNNSSAAIINNQISYTPNYGFEGNDLIQYMACDDNGICATANVVISVIPATPDFIANLVTEINTPVSLTGFDALGFPFFLPPTIQDFPSNGSVLANNNSILYTPNAGFIGQDTFWVELCIDPVSCFDVLITVEVLPGGSTFDLVDDFFQVAPDQTTVMNVLINDSGSNLQITDVTEATNGQVYIINNFLSYTPDPGFEGSDQVSYTACDNFGNCSSATVSIDVSDPNTLVIEVTTPQDVTLYIPLDEFPFPEANWSVMNNPMFGAIQLFAFDTTITTTNGIINFPGGVVIYEPNTGFVGDDEFDLTFDWLAGGLTLTINYQVEVLPTQNCNTDCVWPGDANNNGEVNQFDLLALGLTVGESGAARADASLNWIGQQGDDWGSTIPDLNVNSKFADTDGNGTINHSDTLAIVQNYGLTHGTPGLLPTAPASQQIWLQASSDVIFPGMELTVEIFAATEVLPMVNLYGLGTQLRYDPLFVDPVSVSVEMEANNFMAENSTMLGLVKNHFDGRLDLAYTRTTGDAVNGYGKIGEFTFIVIDNIDGLIDNTGSTVMEISLQGTAMMDHNGEMYNVGDYSISLPVGQTTSIETIENELELEWNTFPNPANEYIQIEWSENIKEVSAITLFDVTGKVALHKDADLVNQTTINLGELTAGFYVLQLTHREGQLRRKVEILK